MMARALIICTLLALGGCGALNEVIIEAGIKAVATNSTEHIEDGVATIINIFETPMRSRQATQRGDNTRKGLRYGECIAKTTGPGPERDKCMTMMERIEGRSEDLRPRCSEYADEYQAFCRVCNDEYSMETDPDSTAFESCMEQAGNPATEPVETCQNLPSRQEFCSCRNPSSDDRNHIYFRACMEVSEL